GSLRRDAALGHFADALDRADRGAAELLHHQHGTQTLLSAVGCVKAPAGTWVTPTRFHLFPSGKTRQDRPMSDAIVGLVTVPNAETADKLGEALVGERLAACVNVVPGIRSIYRWQGKVERDAELLCLIKTTRAGFERLRARVVELHPYEVPEVIALGIELGH